MPDPVTLREVIDATFETGTLAERSEARITSILEAARTATEADLIPLLAASTPEQAAAVVFRLASAVRRALIAPLVRPAASYRHVPDRRGPRGVLHADSCPGGEGGRAVALSELSTLGQYRRHACCAEAPRSGKGDRAPKVPVETFTAFWAVYPRRVGKAKALERWEALSPSDRSAAMVGVQAYAASDLPEEQFIPHGTTWLRERRWEWPLTSHPLIDGRHPSEFPRAAVLNALPRVEHIPSRHFVAEAIRGRDGAACWLCGSPLGAVIIEHLRPRSSYPPQAIAAADRTDNLRLACRPCNTAKGNHAVPFVAPLPITWRCGQCAGVPRSRQVAGEPCGESRSVWCHGCRKPTTIPGSWPVAALGQAPPRSLVSPL